MQDCLPKLICRRPWMGKSFSTRSGTQGKIMGRAHLPVSKSEMGTKSARPEDTAKQKPVHHTIFRPTNFCPTKSEPWAPWLICVKRIKSHKSISRSIFCNISLWNALSIECSLPSPLRILYDTRIAPGQTPEIVKISEKYPRVHSLFVVPTI